MNVVPPLVAYRQPAVTGEPCQRALHHPPVLSQFLAGVDPPAGDARGYAPLPERSAASREVVGFVCVQLRRTLARPTGKSTGALDRLYSVHGFFEDLRVVDVCSLEHYGERDAPSVRNNVALRARFSFIRRTLGPLFGPPFLRVRSPSPRRPAPTRCRRLGLGGPKAPDATLPTLRPPASRAASASARRARSASHLFGEHLPGYAAL